MSANKCQFRDSVGSYSSDNIPVEFATSFKTPVTAGTTGILQGFRNIVCYVVYCFFPLLPLVSCSCFLYVGFVSISGWKQFESPHFCCLVMDKVAEPGICAIDVDFVGKQFLQKCAE